MNSKKAKLIRKQSKVLMVEWLLTVLPDDEKDKININNVNDYVPDQTHFYANKQLRVSSYTLRWFVQSIKKLLKQNKKLYDITLKEIENV
tara:strand:+ start:2389 stop:2658 length:270 start_codon:yes stop_codon:yes gene_type:complete